jgi:glycosyltransferase involved in cell wall biosynthesis
MHTTFATPERPVKPARDANASTDASIAASLARPTPLLSVVIPVYNERYTVRELVRRVAAVDLDKEIILVDDGSTDGSGDILKSLPDRYPNVRVVFQPKNQGKGAAIRAGIAQATGEFLIVQDADLEYDPREYPRLLEPLLSGQADVVYGSRFMTGPRRVHLFWHMIANRVLTLLTNATTNLNLTDMETCYKLFRTSIIKSIPLRSNRFGFEPEVTAKVARLGLRIYELPISYSGRDYAEGKKIGLKDAISAVFVILKYWIVNDVQHVGHHTLTRMAALGPYHRELLATLDTHIGQRVMDLGAGVGNTSRFLLDREQVLLADRDDTYLRLLARKFGGFENVEVMRLDLETFQAAEIEPFALDTIVCLNVLEHIEDDARVLGELAKGLAPGGKLALVVPAHRQLYSGLDRELGHYRRYSQTELCSKLQNAGFDVLELKHFNWVGALGWYAFGKILRRSRISGTATRGYRIASSLRRLEDRRPFPFGLSLVAVARTKPGHGVR